MDSSRPSRLTRLQRDLLAEFFEHEQRFHLTGGAALAGFYLAHRETEDLDLFSPPGPDLEDAVRAMMAAAQAAGATIATERTFPEFRRLLVHRGEETCIVDLVIDRAPSIDPERLVFGNVRVDTIREIAANKVCTLLGRAEIKDLIDLRELLETGIELEQALGDAARKDAGTDPATLAWLLDQIKIAPGAALPAGVDPLALDAFRRSLIERLQEIAFAQARRSR